MYTSDTAIIDRHDTRYERQLLVENTVRVRCIYLYVKKRI